MRNLPHKPGLILLVMILGFTLATGALAGRVPCAPEKCCCLPDCCTGSHQQAPSSMPTGDVDQAPCCLVNSAPLPVMSAIAVNPSRCTDDAPMHLAIAVEASSILVKFNKSFPLSQYNPPPPKIPIYIQKSTLLC
jgi:hypothetical protein